MIILKVNTEINYQIFENGSMMDVETFFYHFENYSIENSHSDRYITGKKLKNNPYFDSKKYNNFKLLFRIIDTSYYEYNEPFNVDYYKDSISDDKILNLIKEYGMELRIKDMYDGSYLKKVYGDSLFTNKFFGNILNSLSTNDFKKNLTELYACYSIWMDYVKGVFDKESLYKFFVNEYLNNIHDDNKKNLPKKFVKEPNSLQYFHDMERQSHLNQSNLYKIDNHLDLVAYHISNKINSKIGIYFDKKSAKFIYKITDHSMFSLAFFQLALLMMNDKAKIKSHVKECIDCKKTFWSNHGNTKSCGCVTKSLRSYRNKKGAKSNG
jgi:hypothetical protein